MYEKITLKVPSDLKYTETVENFVNILLINYDVSAKSKEAHDLKSVFNEAFVNVIKHSPLSGTPNVKMDFFLKTDLLEIIFYDQGRGLKLNYLYPPYPSSMVGKTYPVLNTMDGEVVAYVVNRKSLKLSLGEFDMDEINIKDLVENARDGGMGISFMVKLMDSVHFELTADGINSLRMSKKLKNKKKFAKS